MAAYDIEARADAAAELAPISQGGSGQVVTLTRTVGGAYDPASGATSAGSVETQTCSGVEDSYSAYSIAEGLVLAGDKKFLLSPLNRAGAPIKPPVADVHTLRYANGKVWAVKRVETIAPAGTPVLYELQLRGA